MPITGRLGAQRGAGTSQAERREAAGVSIVVIAVMALAVARSAIGVNLHDGAYYVVVPLRLAQGAHLFADEMAIQALGSLITVPFIMIWTKLFGLEAMSLAVSVFYVVIAAAIGLIAYRLLRPTLRPTVAALAVGLPLLAPPFHIFAPSYNTVAELAFLLATCLAFAALMDGSRLAAASSGVALAVGSLSYPPLVFAALALLATFAVIDRRRRARVVRYAVMGAITAGAACAIALAGQATFAEIRAAMSFAFSNVSHVRSPAANVASYVLLTMRSLASAWLLPMWALVIAASSKVVHQTLRSITLAAIPLAAALPGAVLIARGDDFSFGAAATSWLIIFLVGSLVPVCTWCLRDRRENLLQLMALAAPSAVVGFLAVAFSTNTAWNRGLAAIALVPLSVGVLAGWAEMVAEGFPPAGRLAVLAAPAAVLGLIFATAFVEIGPISTATTLRSGPYAGITTSTTQAGQLRQIERAGQKWVRPVDQVLFMGVQDGYLLVGGRIHTCAVWLPLEASDQAAVDYFSRPGQRWPDVVFVDDGPVLSDGGYRSHARRDPMLARVLTSYERLDSVAGLSVFLARSGR